MRVVRRPRRRGAAAVAAAVVVFLLAGACGGGDDEEARAGDGRSGGPTTSSTAAPASTTAGAPAPAPSTTAAPRTTTTTRRAAATTTTTAASGSAPPAAAGMAFTRPGTYRYTTTGRFTSALGAPQSTDGTATLTVDPPAGTDQHSLRQGPGRSTDQVLRLDPAGALLVSMRITQQGVVKEVRPSPPALALPADAAPGRTWSWRALSTDGLTTVDSAFRALRTEDVTVGGQRVGTLVVEVVLTLSGDLTSTSRQTLWIAAPRGLIVRQDDSTEGRFAGIAFTSTSTDTLQSLDPA